MSTFLCVKNGNQTVTFCPTSETQGNFIRVGNDRFKLRNNHITGRSPYIHVKKDGVTYEIDAKRRTTTELMSEEISGEKFPLDVANSGMSFSTVSGVTNTAENSYVQTVRRTATRFYPKVCEEFIPINQRLVNVMSIMTKYGKSNSSIESQRVTKSVTTESEKVNAYSYTIPAIPEMEGVDLEILNIEGCNMIIHTAQIASTTFMLGSSLSIEKTEITQTPWSIYSKASEQTTSVGPIDTSIYTYTGNTGQNWNYTMNNISHKWYLTEMWKSTEPETAIKNIYAMAANARGTSYENAYGTFGAIVSDYNLYGPPVPVSESTKKYVFGTYSTTDEFTKSVFQSTAYTEVDA